MKKLAILLVLAMGSVGWADNFQPQSFDGNTAPHTYVWEENFSVNKFTVGGGDGEVSTYTDSSTDYSFDDGKLCRLQCTSTGTKYFFLTWSPAKSIVDSTVALSYYIKSGQEPTSLQIQLHTENDTKYYRKQYLPVAVGRHCVALSVGDFHVAGAADAASIVYPKLLIVAGDINDSVYVDSLRIITNRAKATIVFCFDNAYKGNVWDYAIPKLDSFNYKAMIYANYSTSHTPASGYLGPTELLQLQARGYPIGNHTYDHWEGAGVDPNYYWVVQKEIRDNQAWLKSIGITSSRFYFAIARYNESILGTTEINIALHRQWFLDNCLHIKGSIYLGSGLEENTKYFDGAAFGSNCNISNRWHNTTNPTTYAQAKTLIDKAVANNEMCGMFWHNLDGVTDMNTTDFLATVDYVHTADAAGTLEVKTYPDLMPWNPAQSNAKGWLK
jgi:peptidoglycan/xylan/chitin deacetylase (PgdA/CDA1 family)